MQQMADKFMRVVSGMRPTGDLHLGHYHGVLKNWIKLQDEYECFFFVADWHALTTHYDDVSSLKQNTFNMVVDWLASGIDPEKSTIFIQSKIREHAELHTLLSMITPLSWLERVPTYKDQQEKLSNKDLSTYGFLGYPLLQSADILVYQAGMVPVGEDQVAHVELTREIARRFNYLYGREPGFEQKAEAAARKMGKKNAKSYKRLKTEFQQQGNHEALDEATSLIASQANITEADKELLLGFIEGKGKTILPEARALLAEAAKMPGLDGQKMSKSYNNTIALRDDPIEVENKIRTMPTDPARIRRTDPGDPDKCPVWQYHTVYSDHNIKNTVRKGCKSAAIGCVDCKRYIIDAVLKELDIIQTRAEVFIKDPDKVYAIIETGCNRAKIQAQQTMQQIRQVMGLS